MESLNEPLGPWQGGMGCRTLLGLTVLRNLCSGTMCLWSSGPGKRGSCVDLLLPVVEVVVDETKMFPKVPSINSSVTPLFCSREIFQQTCPSDLVCGVCFDLSQLQDL